MSDLEIGIRRQIVLVTARAKVLTPRSVSVRSCGLASRAPGSPYFGISIKRRDLIISQGPPGDLLSKSSVQLFDIGQDFRVCCRQSPAQHLLICRRPGYHTCGNINGKEKNSQKGKGKRGKKGFSWDLLVL